MIRRLSSLKRYGFIRYAVVGAGVAGLYMLILVLMLDYFGTSTAVSIFFAYGISAAARFLLHRSWVFSADYSLMHSHLIKYLVMLGCSYLLNVFMTEALVQNISLEPQYIAVFSAIVATVFAYVVSLKWVFK